MNQVNINAADVYYLHKWVFDKRLNIPFGI